LLRFNSFEGRSLRRTSTKEKAAQPDVCLPNAWQYDVAEFASRHRLSMSQAEVIIMMAGPSRAEADDAAMAAKRRARKHVGNKV
jgi:hypothetical protein